MTDDKNKIIAFLRKTFFIVGIAVAYYVSAQFTLNLAFKHTNVCPVWLPSGIALAGFLFLGESVWLGIWLSVFVLEFQFFSYHHLSLSVLLISSMGVATGNVLEGLIASKLIKRFIRLEEFFNRIQHLPYLLAITCFSCAVSASMGLIVLISNDLINVKLYEKLWFSWWLGNMGGMLLIAPLVIAFNHQIKRYVFHSRVIESAIFFLSLFVVDYFIFDIHSPLAYTDMSSAYPILPLVIWAAYRLGPRRVCSAMILIFVQAIMGTINGTGPFSDSNFTLQESLIMVQIFVLVVSITGLVFMALTAEREVALKELHDSQQLFRALVEHSLDMKMLVNEQAIITYSSPSTERIMGYKKEEHEGTNMFELIHPEDQERIMREFSELLTKPESIVSDSARMQHKNGSWRWVEGTGRNLLGNPAVKSIVVNYRDITENRVIDNILKVSEQRLRQIIDLVPHFIFAKDIEGHFILVNQAVADAYGTTIEGLIGKTDADFNKSQEEVEHFIKDDIEVIRSGKLKIIPEEMITDAQGHIRYLSTTKIPFQASGIELPCVLGVSVDITELKKAEEVLKNDLKQANRLADIGTLSAIVAHELRTPLGVIQMAAHNLKTKHKELVGDKHLENIQKKVWEGNRIIDNLLSYSKIKAPLYDSCLIMPLLEECISNINSQYQDQDVKVEKKYEIDSNAVIQADTNQIREVILNILSNAYQAFVDKSGSLTIEVQKKNNEFLQIAIQDNGQGIDSADLEKIFLPFFTTKAKGTGLGLTICNELINLHHGRLDIQSIKGQGTTVTILLPILK